MNKAALIDIVSQKTGLSKKQVEEVIESTLDEITDSLKDRQEVTLTSFGTFSARVRSERWGVNPQKPSERIRIPEVVVPKFKAGKGLKDALKGKEKKSEHDAPSTPEMNSQNF